MSRDALDKLAEEAAPLDLSRDRVVSNARIVEYPWLTRPRFVVLPEPAVYNRIVYSRNSCVVSEATQSALSRLRIGIAGLSVGGVAGLLLVRSGCTSILGVDGGLLDGKDLNRSGFGVASRISMPQATAFRRACLEVNPYCDIEAHAEFLGEGGFPVVEFVRRADVVIDAVDSLAVKWELRLAAKAEGKTVIMATDLGSACLLQVEAPGVAPFFGRISAEQVAHHRRNPRDGEIRTALAMAMVGGPGTIPTLYLGALEEARRRGLGFWPQLGEASHLSAAVVTKAIRDHIEGRLRSRETLIELP